MRTSKWLWLLIITGIILILSMSQVNALEYKIVGKVLSVKTGPPYPFETKDGRIWECKIKIEYLYYDYEYGWIYVKYKAYPLRYSGYEWACNISENAYVEALVRSKKDTLPPKRGDIIYIHGLE